MAIFNTKKWNSMEIVPSFDKRILVIWSDGDEVEYENLKQLMDFSVLVHEKVQPVLWSYITIK